MLLVVAAITFKFYRKFYCKFYCTCDQSISIDIVCRFFVPKYARHETLFFKELKKQDECEDDVEKELELGGCDEEQETRDDRDEVDDVTEHTLASQHLTDDEMRQPATDDDDNDNEAVTEFTSLQSCTYFC